MLALSCKAVLIGFNNPLLQVCHESHMRWTVINHEHNGGGKYSNNSKIKRKKKDNRAKMTLNSLYDQLNVNVHVTR